jgi:MFS superfamily sulfate permease-like transporter
MLCGFVGALPMTGVIVRSSANVQAGAKTRASTMFHGLWLLAFVVAMPFVLRFIPVSALAAVLVYTGYKLVDVKNIKHLQQYGRIPLLIYFATVIGIVAIDLLSGVLIGIALSIAKLLYKVTRLGIRVEDGDPGRIDLYLEGAATFLKLPRLAAALDKVPHGTELHVHCQRLVYIDHSCLDLINNWQRQHAVDGSKLIVEWEGLLDRFRKPMSAAVMEPEPVPVRR